MLISKNEIDIDTTIVKLKFVLKGFRQEIVINTTLAESCEFVDIMNENRGKSLTRRQKEMMENKYYTFNDYIKKETVSINFDEVKVFTVPFIMNVDNKAELKILTFNN